tara:strand:- start:13 stop:609 length:597 start_codon:yes stop_codon:yes gene_type:complete
MKLFLSKRDKILPQKIKVIRLRLNISQSELAKRIGCSRVAVSMWEGNAVKDNRKVLPSRLNLKKLANLVDIPLEILDDEKFSVEYLYQNLIGEVLGEVLEDSLEKKYLDRRFNPYKNLQSSSSMKQVGGNHYEKKKIQPWDVTLDWKLDPWLASVVRYISRHQDKNGIEDIRKAIHYLKYVEENYSTIKEKYYGVGEK